MIKWFVVLFASLNLSPSFAYMDYQYKENPKALQKALLECPQHNPKGISCDQLKILAQQINESVHELQTDPQKYGQRILALQELIAEQSLAVNKGFAPNELQASLKENIQQLHERLAIVKWLESPGS